MSMGSGGIFGNPKKLGGLFGNRWGGMDESGAMGGGFQVGMDGGPDAPEMAQAPKQGGGFFGQGGVGRAIAGYLGDALLQQADMQPLYSPIMQQKQAEAFRMKNAEAARAAGREDFLWKQQHTPQAMDEFTKTLIHAGIDPNSDEGRKYYLNKANSVGDPLVTITLPGDRGLYIGRQSGLADALRGAFGTAAPAAHDTQSTVEDGYQYIPGPGGRANKANWKAVGGGVGNGTGGFR